MLLLFFFGIQKVKIFPYTFTVIFNLLKSLPLFGMLPQIVLPFQIFALLLASP